MEHERTDMASVLSRFVFSSSFVFLSAGVCVLSVYDLVRVYYLQSWDFVPISLSLSLYADLVSTRTRYKTIKSLGISGIRDVPYSIPLSAFSLVAETVNGLYRYYYGSLKSPETVSSELEHVSNFILKYSIF